MTKQLIRTLLGAIALILSHASISGIVAVTGDVSILTTPDTLIYTSQINYTASPSLINTHALIFPERVGYTVPAFSSGSLLEFAISQPGVYGNTGAPGSLSTGDVVNSYVLHFGPENNFGQASGSITFAEEIVGLMPYFGLRPLTEGEFQLPGIDLRSSSGLELGISNPPSVIDTLTFSGDRRNLIFSFNVDGASEVLRVFTVAKSANAIPEPSTIALLGIGLFGLGVATRKRTSASKQP